MTRVHAAHDSFATTRWSVIRSAAGHLSSVDVREALDELCRIYWPPLYAYLRRQGYASGDAEDLVQGFFADLLPRDNLAQLDSGKGTFRSFLLAALKHFLANEHDRSRAVKRGGRQPIVSLDPATAQRHASAASDDREPDTVFERAWALTLLDRVRGLLESNYRERGRAERFEILSPCLTGDGSSYHECAARLGMTEGAVKVVVHRLRQEFRDLLRAEIAQTVLSAEEIDEEIRSLFDALRR